MECHNTNRHTANPVFYVVEPTEVRKQSEAIGEALAKHTKNELAGKFLAMINKKTAKQSKIKFGKWRETLKEATNLSGWDLRSLYLYIYNSIFSLVFISSLSYWDIKGTSMKSYGVLSKVET